MTDEMILEKLPAEDCKKVFRDYLGGVEALSAQGESNLFLRLMKEKWGKRIGKAKRRKGGAC